jgi:hypothetical protein
VGRLGSAAPVPAPHPNPLAAHGERERAGAQPLAPFTGRGRGPRGVWEGEGPAQRWGFVRLVAPMTLLLLTGCGYSIGWPKPPPQPASLASAWTAPGVDAATVETAFGDCLAVTDTATRTDFDIDQDIAVSRSSDLQHSAFAQTQMQQARDTSRDRAQTILSSCMEAKGFSPAK